MSNNFHFFTQPACSISYGHAYSYPGSPAVAQAAWIVGLCSGLDILYLFMYIFSSNQSTQLHINVLNVLNLSP